MGKNVATQDLLNRMLDLEARVAVAQQCAEAADLRATRADECAAQLAAERLPALAPFGAENGSGSSRLSRREALTRGALAGAAGLTAAVLTGQRASAADNQAILLGTAGDTQNHENSTTTIKADNPFPGGSTAVVIDASPAVGTLDALHLIGSSGGRGLLATGGASVGWGVEAVGGAAGGLGLVARANGVAAQGLIGEQGVNATGSGGAPGVYATGGATNGNGVEARGGGTLGWGLQAVGGSGGIGSGVGVVARASLQAIATGLAGGQGVNATGTGNSPGVYATGGGSVGSGVEAVGGATGGLGLVARANGVAAQGLSGEQGVNATGSGSAPGVYATGGATSGFGMDGHGGAPNGAGIRGAGTGSGTGVFAIGGGSGGHGILALGDPVAGVGGAFRGGRAPIFLGAAAAAGPPTTGRHFQGDLWCDSRQVLWMCIADGTPGTFAPIQYGGLNQALFTAVSTGQYTLTSSDGATWVDLDGTNLKLTITPSFNCQAILSGNSDLWTSTAGFNQDLGITISGGAYPTVAGQPEAWKESGGFAGTFSPNAAFVETVKPLVAGTTYTIKLQWKANKNAPGVTIWAGAGPIPLGSSTFSPTRLTALLIVSQ